MSDENLEEPLALYIHNAELTRSLVLYRNVTYHLFLRFLVL